MKGQSDNQTSDKKGEGHFFFPVEDHSQGPAGRASLHVLWVLGGDHVPDSCGRDSGVYTVCLVSGQPGVSRNPDGRGARSVGLCLSALEWLGRGTSGPLLRPESGQAADGGGWTSTLDLLFVHWVLAKTLLADRMQSRAQDIRWPRSSAETASASKYSRTGWRRVQ